MNTTSCGPAIVGKQRLCVPAVCVALQFLAPFASTAQAQPAGLIGRAEQIAIRGFDSSKCPGMSLSIARQGKIVFSAAYGMSDIEQTVPLRVSSAHRLASISKPITATIVMSLVEDGKLTLDLPVRHYLPELPSSYRNMTIRHLLNHQSGIKGYTNPADVAFSTIHYATSREAMKSFMSYPLAYEPGTRTEYSSRECPVDRRK